jgi:hypothetical protein
MSDKKPDFTLIPDAEEDERLLYRDQAALNDIEQAELARKIMALGIGPSYATKLAGLPKKLRAAQEAPGSPVDRRQEPALTPAGAATGHGRAHHSGGKPMKPRDQGKLIDSFHRQLEDLERLKAKRNEHHTLAAHYAQQVKVHEARCRETQAALRSQGIELPYGVSE